MKIETNDYIRVVTKIDIEDIGAVEVETTIAEDYDGTAHCENYDLTLPTQNLSREAFSFLSKVLPKVTNAHIKRSDEYQSILSKGKK